MKHVSHRFAVALGTAVAMLAAPLPAAAADVSVQPEPGGSFVVTNADKTSDRFRVTESGSVTVTGSIGVSGSASVSGTAQLNGAVQINKLKTDDYVQPIGNILVCADTATGRLTRCAPPESHPELGKGPIYIKKEVFDVGIDYAVQTFVSECDHPKDLVIGAVAYIDQSKDNRIELIDYQNNYLQVVHFNDQLVDRLHTTITCMRTR